MKNTAAVLLALFLASSVWAVDAGAPFSESAPRRFETVFFISIPFTSLYSSLLVLGVSAVVQKGDIRFTVPYQATTAGLSLLAAGWIAWHDHETGGPDLREVTGSTPPAMMDLSPK